MLDRSLAIEILKRDAAKNHPERDPREIVQAFNAAAKDPNVTMMHRNGSILVIDEKPTGTEFHFINSVRLAQFAQNVEFLFDKAKAMGFKKMKAVFTNPKILEVADLQPYPTEYTKEGDTYTLTVRL